MSDNTNPSKGELILSGDHSVAIRKSDMVKRGLDLIKAQTKRRLQILMATGKEPSIERIWIKLLEEKGVGKYDFSYFVTAFTFNEILRLAQTNEIDMFMLVLNNIAGGYDDPSSNISPVSNQRFGTRPPGASLQLITYLKNTYGRAVVAFSAYDDIDMGEKATQAGADFYFQMPFKLEDVSEALMICLHNIRQTTPTGAEDRGGATGTAFG